MHRFFTKPDEPLLDLQEDLTGTVMGTVLRGILPRSYRIHPLRSLRFSQTPSSRGITNDFDKRLANRFSSTTLLIEEAREQRIQTDGSILAFIEAAEEAGIVKARV
ncbi:uncharacterized protein LOC111788614 [Cucurbita pepo subsp. pepo]|uniref:uncharacterized protein LOC111788614 n=1 Tax=Cucurbita pepo subsp. pepo TaxID=3664 RepID=UPI000C9D623F|nr:uncharacterized protein LOC111788614 [Cucurbita pepo subsp. pepo]